MKKISCIIPTYNRGEVLPDTIRQLLDQDHLPHEIVVVDQTRSYEPQVMRKMLEFAKASQIIWICQLAPNASMARNIGSMVATGDILLLLDDDIRVDRRFIAAHAANYEQADCDAVAGQVLDGDAHTTDSRLRRHRDKEWDSLLFPKNYMSRTKTPWMISSNFSIYRSIYFSLGGMDEWYDKGAFREESDFALRFYRSGRLFQFDPAASLYHLGHEVVKGGGCRSFTSVWGGWHHFVGSWYFTLGFARISNFLVMIWTHFRGLVFNAKNLRSPMIFLARMSMFFAAIPVAFVRRVVGPKLINTPKIPLQ